MYYEVNWFGKIWINMFLIGVLDCEGNVCKVVNCFCVVVKDWGEELQECFIIFNYFVLLN